MPENTNKIIAELQPAECLSLPELLLRELELLDLPAADRAAGETDLDELVAGDVFLALRRLAGGDNRDAATLLRQCAARMGFARLPAPRLRFLKQLYLQSTLTRCLAEEIAARVLPDSPERDRYIRLAGYAGLTLNIGALALEQVHGKHYLALLQQTGDTETLLAAERREYGLDHAELGAALMRHWGADTATGDAVRYHHQPIGEILDATRQVRIAWLANQLADDEVSPEAEVWADTLFDLEADVLTGIRDRARARLDAVTAACNMVYSSTRYLPLPDSAEDDVLEREKTALRELRERAEADSLFAAVRANLALAPDLGAALGDAVQQLFGDYACILFARSAAGDSLESVAGSVNAPAEEALTIRCLAERSAIADSCLQDAATFRLPETGLTVVDRQVLSRLDADNFCCQPCVDADSGEVRGVLVLGVPLQQAERLKKQRYLRTCLGRELGRHLGGKRQAAKTPGDDVAATYERRIRETIHEVNNPLGIIKNYLQLLSMKQEDDAKVKSEISFIKSEIDRVGTILQSLRKPPEPGFRKAVNVNTVVRNLASMFQGSFAAGDNVRVETALDPALPEILCSEDAIRQIVTNLVKNAAEAFSEGGTIVISTAGNVYMNGERYIQVGVSDDGPGLSAEILDRLFTTGASTKGGDQRGSGLAIVNNLVKNLRGQITCRTNPADNAAKRDAVGAAGTSFTVLLPLSRPSETSGNVQ